MVLFFVPIIGPMLAIPVLTIGLTIGAFVSWIPIIGPGLIAFFLAIAF